MSVTLFSLQSKCVISVLYFTSNRETLIIFLREKAGERGGRLRFVISEMISSLSLVCLRDKQAQHCEI